MYTPLSQITLKTGERMEIGCVDSPDAEWAERITSLMGHKGQPWQYHVETAVREPLDELQTLFYLGTIDGRPVTNVMIVGPRRTLGTERVGILGHVYTVPEQRRKGAYSQLMAVQMAHTRSLGYRVLTLGTGFESAPYWIYHGFGFRSLDGTSGRMKWVDGPDAEAHWFRPGGAGQGQAGRTSVRPLRWEDWGPLNLLAGQPTEDGEELPRSWAFGLAAGYGSLERSFLDLRRAMRHPSPPSLDGLRQALGAETGGSAPVALTLESEHGAAVGWAVLQPDELALRRGRRLDLFVHPAFRSHIGQLLEAALSLPRPGAGRIAAYSSGPEGYRAAALRAAGFQQVATLPGWIGDGENARPLYVFAGRETGSTPGGAAPGGTA